MNYGGWILMQAKLCSSQEATRGMNSRSNSNVDR